MRSAKFGALPAWPIVASLLLVTLIQSSDAAAGDFEVPDPYFLAEELNGDTHTISFGTWELTPTIEVGAGYADNVAEEPIKDRDAITAEKIGLALRGNFGLTEVKLTGGVEAFIAANAPEENILIRDASLELHRDYNENIKGKISIDFVDYWPGYKVEEVDHERNLDLKPSIIFELGRNALEIRGTAAWVGFPDAVDGSGSPVIDARQHLYGDLTVIVSRKVAEDLAFYLGALARLSEFDRKFDDDGYARGGKGYGVFAGFRGNIADNLEADIAVGISQQDFKDTDFEDTAYPTVNGYLQWRPKDDVRLTLIGGSGFSESDDYGAAGFVSHEGELRVEIKPVEKMVLIGAVNHERLDYLSTDIIENTTEIETGIDYSLSKYVIASLRYIYRNRKSDDPEETFDSNTIRASLRFN